MLWLYLNIGKPLLKEDRINKLWLFPDTKGSLSSLDGSRRQASEEINISSIKIKVNSSSFNSKSIYS